LTVGVFAASCYAVLSWNLYRHHDDELADQAASLVATLSTNTLTPADIREALSTAANGSRFVMIRDDRGALVYRDSALASAEPDIGQHKALVHAATAGSRVATFFTVALARSGDVRFICLPLRQAGVYLQVGDPLGDVRATLRNVTIMALPLIPAVLLLSTLGGRMIVTRALAPLDSVTATLENIQATDLSRRVEVHPTDRELGALVATLNQLLDRLQHSFESLREFAGDVSHQVLTPLTVIKAVLDTEVRAPSHVDDTVWLQSLTEEVEAIRAIVVSLQSLARADEPVRDAAVVDLSDAVQEAIDIVAALGELRDVQVESDVAPHVAVRGDVTRLRQVVLNLGDNAVKYTPAGGKVTIRLEAPPGKALVRVTDTGIGISAEHQPLVFDRLFRTEAADHRAPGTGLGLAIVKRIVEAHGGTIEVHSRVGEGSTFTVTLPRA